MYIQEIKRGITANILKVRDLLPGHRVKSLGRIKPTYRGDPSDRHTGGRSLRNPLDKGCRKTRRDASPEKTRQCDAVAHVRRQ